MPVTDSVKGFGVTFRHLFKKPVTQQFPNYKRAGVPALPRPAPPAPARERPREVRRLLAVRRRLPGRLHPRGGRREHARRALLGRRAVRPHLRDQHEPLHLLRLLRAGLPVRCDHARPRLRAGRDVARRDGVHQGDAARARAGSRTHPGGAGRPVRHPGSTAGVEEQMPPALHLRHRVRRRHRARDRLGAGRGAVGEPVLLRPLADPEPGGAGDLLPAAAGRLPGRRAGDRVRRRGHDHVPVRDRLPGRPRRRADPAATAVADRDRVRRRRWPWWSRWCSRSAARPCPRGRGVSDSFGAPANVATSLPAPLPAGLRGHLDPADGGRRWRSRAGHAAGRAAAAGRARLARARARSRRTS